MGLTLKETSLSTIACVFPGQGSQTLGMLSELAADYPLVRVLFDEVSTHLGYDVWRLVQDGPLAVLNQTAQTQVAMLTADVAVFRVLEQHLSLRSAILAGHSLGEYAALVCANAITLTDAAKLVQTRGQLMQETVPMGVGAMAAIVGLSDDVVRALCDEVSTESLQASPANYNAIGQVVIAGHTSTVEKAMRAADAHGARLTMLIPVSVPCHCALLQPAAARFADVLQTVSFHVPEQEVISTIDLHRYHAVDDMRRLLAEQLYRPVRWVETVQAIRHRGVTQALECGPGKVLAGLIKRIDKSLRVISVNDSASLTLALDDFDLRGE